MSNDIRSENRNQSRLIRELQNDHKREINQLERGHAKELKFKQDSQDKKMEEIKVDHLVTVDDVNRQNSKEVREMHEHKEKKLSQMRDQLDREHTKTEEKLDYLRASNQDQRMDERAKHRHLSDRNKERFDREITQDQFATKMSNDRYKASKTRERNEIVSGKQREIAEIKNRFSSEYDKVTRNLENRMKTLNQKQDSEIKQLKQTNLGERKYVITKGETDLKNLNQNYEKEFKKNEQVNTQKTKERQAEFERRFNTMERNEFERLTNLQGRADFQKNLVRKDFAKYQDHYVDKAKDPFYRMQQLDPRIFEREEDFIIEIKVPEHEKDYYLLSGNSRTLRLTFNRDFQNEFLDQDGSVLKSKKFESAVKTIPVTAPVDRNGITKTYRDGTVRFTVLKA